MFDSLFLSLTLIQTFSIRNTHALSLFLIHTSAHTLSRALSPLPLFYTRILYPKHKNTHTLSLFLTQIHHSLPSSLSLSFSLPSFPLLYTHNFSLSLTHKQTHYLSLSLSLDIHPNWLSFLVNPLDSIQCPHKTVVSMSPINQENVTYDCFSSSLCMSCSSYWMIFEMGSKLPFLFFFFFCAGCWFQDLFKTARSIFI